jgi:hypothetical protein
VAGINRNRWPASPGTGVRNKAEYAIFLFPESFKLIGVIEVLQAVWNKAKALANEQRAVNLLKAKWEANKQEIENITLLQAAL